MGESESGSAHSVYLTPTFIFLILTNTLLWSNNEQVKE